MTRRTVALSLAVAVVWVTPVAGGQGPDSPPDAASRGVVVSDWATSGADGARTTSAAGSDDWMVSGVIDAQDAVLVGADWGGDHDTEVQVRARDAQGWGEWIELHVHDEHTPDTGTPEAAATAASTASDPVFLGRVDDLQFRVSGAEAPELDVELVDIPGDLSWTPDQARTGAAVAATEFPMVRPRASWGADESIRSRKVSYADDVRFSVIHHEGGAPRWSDAAIEGGCQSADDAIRAIYEYHVRTRGYWDIAYNFIVDPCGGIWEGRAGGIDKAVMGAHAGGWNSGSVGVLALGTFSDGNADPVTDDMVAGIEKLLAWKLDVHHADTRGTVREVSGGGSSRYREGTAVDVPILSAHQITNSTSCPGAVLMDRLFTGKESWATPRWSYANNVYRTGLPKAFDEQPARRTVSASDQPSWDVTTTEPVDWSLRITDAEGELVRATGGTGEDHIERTWDLRDSNGDLVDAGTYTATITGVGATGEITPVVTELVVASSIPRRMGGTRVGTAIALSKWAFDSADTAIVASSEAYPDALVSGPLAGSLDAPVLLTPQNDLPESVKAEIRRLGVSTVYVIGGQVAISSSVAKELQSDLAGVTVERIGGADRFATAALVADRVAGDDPVSEVLLSLGHHKHETSAFPDALSAGAFGADLRLPVLLTKRDELPDATRTALKSMGPDTVTAFGGTVAIADSVTSSAASASGASVDRFAGDTRYGTSRLAAEELLRRRGVLAPGETADDQPSDDSTATEEPTEDPTSTEEPTDDPTTEEPTDDPTTEEPTDDPTTEEPTEETSEAPVDDGKPIDLIFASGGNWPDALGAGAAAAKTGTVFLLAHPTSLADGAATGAFLERWESRIGDASVAGGPVAIAGAVVTAIAKYVKTNETVETEPIDWPKDPHAGA